MHPTDTNKEAVFFAEWLLPLSQAHLRRGISYLNRERDADSFWGPVVSRSGGMQRLAPEACGAAELLAALDNYWEQTNEDSLRRLAPHLRKLLLAIAARPVEASEQAAVAEFVYPLY